MVSKPYPIQSKANPSKKSNPIFITQQNLHAIQMAFLNKNFHLDWNPTQLWWTLIGSVQSMDFFQSSPLTALSTLYICPLSSTTKSVTKTLVLIQSHYAEFHQIIETTLVRISKHQDILRNSYVTTKRQSRSSGIFNNYQTIDFVKCFFQVQSFYMAKL